MIYYKRKAIWKRLIPKFKLPLIKGFFGFLKCSILTILLLVIFIYSGYLFLLPKYITDDKVETCINDYLKAHSKLSLDIEHLKIIPDYKFDIKLSADRLSLDFPNKKRFLSLEKPDVEINLISLLFNRIDLSKIKTKKIIINTNFTKNNHYDCFDYFDNSIFSFNDSKLNINNLKFICDEFILNLFDENIKQNFKFLANNLTVAMHDNNKPVNIKASGFISANKKIADFKLNLQFNLQKELINTYTEKISKLNYNPLIHALKFKFYTNSDIDLKISKDNINGFIKLDKFSFVINDIQIPENTFNLVFKGNKIKLIGDFNLIKDQFIKINLNARYNNNKFIELKLNSSEIDLFDFKKLVCALIKIFNLKYNLDLFNIDGKTSADLYLKSDFRTIVSQGFLNIKNAKISDIKTGFSLNNINSNINFNNNIINIQNTSFLANNAKFHLAGFVDDKTNLDLKINSDNIDIAQIINTVKNLPLLSSLIPELNDYVFNSGFVKVNALIKGTINNPIIKTNSTVTNLKLYVKTFNCMIQSGEILISANPENNVIKNIFITAKNNIISVNNNKIYNAISKLKVVDKNIVIDKTTVVFDKIKAEIEGVINNYSTLDLTINAIIPLDNDLIVIKNKTPKLNASIFVDKNKLTIKNAKLVEKSADLINISGNIFDFSSKNPKFDNLKISLLQRISCILPKFDNLFFETIGDVYLSGSLEKPVISGSLTLYNVICKKYNLFIQDCILFIKNSNLQGSMTSLNVLDATLKSVLFEGNLKGDTVELSRFSAEAFEGKIQGKGEINIKSFKTSLELVLKEISVRHLTSYLKQSSIAVSGRLSAFSRLNFTGLDYESVIHSLNGYIKFNVDNGELNQFAKLERLLQAGNILSQSILKLTLNSIVSSVARQNTGDFKTIEGTIKIQSPMAEIQYINTQGTNMSLHIEGRYNILNNHAILRVLGRIPQNIVNVMGNIGKFSLSQLFDADTGSSAIEKMMSVYISDEDKSKIPELALYQENSPTREFIVLIDGLLNNNSSIKYFKWAFRN